MKHLRLWQASLLVALFTFWWAMTTPGLLPNVMFDNDRQAAFFFGEPLKVQRCDAALPAAVMKPGSWLASPMKQRASFPALAWAASSLAMIAPWGKYVDT